MSPRIRRRHIRWQAAILAALGERQRAVERLRVAMSRGEPLWLWHWEPGLAALRGFPPFEELMLPDRRS